MTETFKEILTCTPPTPTRPPLRPACDQGHGEPFSVTQFRASAPPTPLKPSAQGSRQPTPGHGPSAPHRPCQPPNTRGPGRERAKGRPAAIRRQKAPGDGDTPTGTGHGRQHNTGAGNHRRATNTGSRTGQGYGRGWTRGSSEEGHTTPEGPTPPHPPTSSQHRETPRGHQDQDQDTRTRDRAPPRHTPTTTRHRSPELTAREPHRVASTQGTTENLPLHPNRQVTTPATFRRKGHHTDTRARAPEGKGTRLRHQRVGADTEARRQQGRGASKAPAATPPHSMDPGSTLGIRTHRAHGTKGGQLGGHPPNAMDLTARPDPPGHQPSEPLKARPRPPATSRPHDPSSNPHSKATSLISAGTTSRWTKSTTDPPHSMAQQSTAQHDTTQHSTPHCSTAHHTTLQHGTAQHDAARRSRAKRSLPQHSKAPQDTTGHGTAQRSREQHSTVRKCASGHSKTRHSTTRHIKAHHGTGARNTNLQHNPTAPSPPHTPGREETRPQQWETTTPAHHVQAKSHHTPGGTNPPTLTSAVLLQLC